MRLATGIAVASILALVATACRPAAPRPVSADIVAMMSGSSEGFARADQPRPIVFSADEGPHPAYRTEWWYYTGHLFARADVPPGAPLVARPTPDAMTPDAAPPFVLEREAAGRRRFGFQLTFFRTSLAPPNPSPSSPPTLSLLLGQASSPSPRLGEGGRGVRASLWTTTQAYLAHFTVTDVEAGRFHSAERLARGALGLAGARAEPYRVWLGPWSAATWWGIDQGEPPPPLSSIPFDRRDGQAARGGVRLQAADGPVAIDVTVGPARAPALHGQEGWSRKGPEPGNASYYYSYSRMSATGVVTTAAGAWPVEGGVWMDHEWSTSALADGRQGWDWLSLQLDDGRDIMAFQIRDASGAPAPESSGSVIDFGGVERSFGASDFALTPQGTWRSPRSGARYPSGWRLELPGDAIDLRLTPLLADQELSTGFRYWEGAVKVDGTAGGSAVLGRGYVELTGYAAASAP